MAKLGAAQVLNPLTIGGRVPYLDSKRVSEGVTALLLNLDRTAYGHGGKVIWETLSLRFEQQLDATTIVLAHAEVAMTEGDS